MTLPFTVEQFFEVIRSYNAFVWPGQIALTACALVALALVFVRKGWASTVVWSLLALLWIWIGAVYQLAFFWPINPAAIVFAALFFTGAACFLWFGVYRRELTFSPGRNGSTATGIALVAYALVVYPLWSTASGHAYPALPTFGLPCPTTIFTIGVVCMASGRRVWAVLVAPVLWSLVGVQAAFLLTVWPDLGLGVAGGVGIAIAVMSLRGRSRELLPA